jgi:hypothetical protein
METIRHLFQLISEADPEVMRIFWSWLTDRDVKETAEEMCTCG